MNFISASRKSFGIQSFAQMIDHLHLKNRRLPLNNEGGQTLVGEVNSLDRMRPGSFATYEMQRPFRASQVSVTADCIPCHTDLICSTNYPVINSH